MKFSWDMDRLTKTHAYNIQGDHCLCWAMMHGNFWGREGGNVSRIQKCFVSKTPWNLFGNMFVLFPNKTKVSRKVQGEFLIFQKCIFEICFWFWKCVIWFKFLKNKFGVMVKIWITKVKTQLFETYTVDFGYSPVFTKVVNYAIDIPASGNSDEVHVSE